MGFYYRLFVILARRAALLDRSGRQRTGLMREADPANQKMTEYSKTLKTFPRFVTMGTLDSASSKRAKTTGGELEDCEAVSGSAPGTLAQRLRPSGPRVMVGRSRKADSSPGFGFHIVLVN